MDINRREHRDGPGGDPVWGARTRLQEHTQSIPKALVEIGGRPILWHVIQIYLAQGFRSFLLLTGYRGDQVREFATAAQWPADAHVRCLDTVLETPTGGRIWPRRDELDGAVLRHLRGRSGGGGRARHSPWCDQRGIPRSFSIPKCFPKCR